MRKTWIIAILVVLAIPAFGTTRYIAQTSGTFSGGTACNGQTAITPASFNLSTNSPGDTNYICGTITFSAGATGLTPLGNGTSGLPVSIIFDTGAILEAPYFTCGIQLGNRSYYVVNGQNTGTIENTANGTGLTYQHTSSGICAYSQSNTTIENLTIANIYRHTSTSDSTVDQSEVFCINWSGPNMTITGNTEHDAGFCNYSQPVSGDSWTVSYNTIYNIDHGQVIANSFSGGTSGPYLYHHNTVGGYSNWDTTSNSYHHDGFHCWSYATDQGAHITTLAIYDNTFQGPVGTNINEQIFLEDGTGTSGDTPCADSTSNIYIFNNIVLSDSSNGNNCSGSYGMNNGIVGPFSEANYIVANNTFYTSQANTASCSVGPHFDAQPTSIIFKNNAISSFNSLVNYCPNESSCTVPLTNDYNQYANGGSNAFVWKTTYTTSFATWKSDSGGDAHSANNSSLNINTSTYVPNAGSPLIGSGTNLTSLCTGYLVPLCSDYGGTARPSVGAWTVGAYQYGSGSGTTVSGPTNLTGSITVN